jgi:hypothetical protein
MNDNEDSSKWNEINDSFKLPIYYNSNKIELKNNIITDLELTNTIDPSYSSIYSYYLNCDNIVSKKVVEQTAKYYTNDIEFLQDTQDLLKHYKTHSDKYIDYSSNYKQILDIWSELKIETGFKEKYYYIDWDIFEFLNRSSNFLQFISIYNLFSPILSLCVPIIILIIPFIIVKAKGLQLTINEYIDVLKMVASHNAIGKLFTTNFIDIKLHELIYIIISAAFYLFSIYQNIMVCVRFNNNMVTIHNHFQELKIYLNKTITSMENYLHFSDKLVTYQEFNLNLKTKMNTLNNIYQKITPISRYSLCNVSKVAEIGNILKYFYELHSNKTYEEAMLYSLGFNGYIDCIDGLLYNIEERKINYAEFINDNKKSIIKNNYYACLKDTKHVKNTIKFRKNMIITGPNASGKTTILKSSLINIIFTQQFGCGFYDSAKICPFKYIHCYLNIPDTSGRDSLFQAEARRCKEILDIVNNNSNSKHFCIFDELYSGTNPEEAEMSATAFMKYLTQFQNVSCLLTTHFVKVCKKLNKNTNIINCYMRTAKENNKLIYKYKLEKGISLVKGGINVLTEMNYPKEILEDAIK